MTAATASASAPAVGRPELGATLTGTARMVRFMLRRDRVRLSVWTASIVFFYAYFVVALGAMGDEALAGRALIMETPSGIAMGGPGYGIENYTVGVAIANEGITWMVMALAIMSILHVVRHTRGEEESGRSELVRAGVVGRHAPAVAATITMVMANAVIAIVSALALNGVSEGDLGLGDSFALTVGSGLSAIVFGAIALVAAQVTEHGRGAVGVSLAAFGLAYVVRAAGDIQERHGSTLSWFSPIGWAQQMRPFVDVRWWPVVLSVLATALFLLLGAFLGSRRDFGAGMVAARAGRADARATLRGPVTLAWIQQRTVLTWCALGLGLMWYATGTLLPDITSMIAEIPEGNPVLAAMFGEDTSQFTAAFMGVAILFAMLSCAAYTVVMGQRPEAEERTGRVLWPYLPALAVYLRFTAAVYAWFPRAAGTGWALLIYTFVIGMFGSLLEDMPDWVHQVSPFYWLPTAFVEEPETSHMLGLTGVAVLLLTLALVGFRRRDLLGS